MSSVARPQLSRWKHAAAKLVRRAVPIRGWVSALGAPLLLPLYHLVSDAPAAHVVHLYRSRTVREFERDLDFFLRHFEPVGLDAVVRFAGDRRSLRRPAFHLTFDDGFREGHEIAAPILRRKGIPATFFLSTGFLDGRGLAHDNKLSLLVALLAAGASGPALREITGCLPPPADAASGLDRRILAIPHSESGLVDRIARLLDVDFPAYVASIRPHLSSVEARDLVRQGFTLGAHSVDHPWYARIPLEEQLAQTRNSLEFVTTQLGAQIRAFAFPYNDEQVTPGFFERAFAEGGLDVSFGTNGFARHYFPRNLERVVMERDEPDGAATLIAAYAREARHRWS